MKFVPLIIRNLLRNRRRDFLTKRLMEYESTKVRSIRFPENSER